MAVYVLVILALFIGSDAAFDDATEVAQALETTQIETAAVARVLETTQTTENEETTEASKKKSSTSRPGPTPFTYTDAARNTSPTFDPGAPATKATTRLLELAEQIDATRKDTIYSHGTRVDRKAGKYHFDCSGMLNWMLKRVSKRSLETLDRERPVASTYVRTIQKAPKSRGRNGWQNIVDIEQVEPGDLFAWRRPADWPKGGNTGHVGIVIARPARVPHLENAYLVRVLDSTRYQHQDDTRQGDETGFGMGSILFVTDDARQPIGYAWYGALSSGFYETDVVFGRIH